MSPDKLQIYRNLYKAQVGFDVIVDCLEEKDYDMAMLIATHINLGVQRHIRRRKFTMKMLYNVNQLMKAAEYIWEHNNHVDAWPNKPQSVMDVMRIMLNLAERQGVKNMRDPDNWVSWVGTGGYVLIITSDDPDTFVVEFLIDPNVSNEGRWVHEWIDDENA
jgi:hypothetical protein